MTIAAFIQDKTTGLGRWWQEQFEKLRDIDSLRAMTPREIEDLSGEMGLSRGQLEALIMSGPRAAAEMEQMMAALGIDPAKVATAYPAMTRDMKVTCAGCGDKRTCRQSLTDETAEALFASFCPNAGELGEMQRRPDLRAS